MHRHLPKFILATISSAFTAFIFMNTYEVVFNQDIAIAHSVKKVESQNIINNIIDEFSTKTDAEANSANSRFDNLDHLEIPALKAHVQIEEGRKINHLWYQRPSMAHYIGLNKDSQGITVDYLIYTSKSWQVIASPDQIEEGMEVQFYYRNGAMSLFEVAEKKVLPQDRSFIVNKSEDRQILLVVEDDYEHVYYGYSLVQKK